MNDIINLFPVAEELKFIDITNVGVEGWSRGGMMTFLLLKEKPVFKCAVLSGAISNLSSLAESVGPQTNYKKIM